MPPENNPIGGREQIPTNHLPAYSGKPGIYLYIHNLICQKMMKCVAHPRYLWAPALKFLRADWRGSDFPTLFQHWFPTGKNVEQFDCFHFLLHMFPVRQ